LPLILSMGAYTVMQFCDRVFLAQHSAVSIQAALPGGMLAFTLICGFMELAGYGNTFVAQYHGAGDREGCGRSLAQAVILALASWPVILLLIPLGRGIISLAGHAPEVMQEERVYFTILMAGGVTIPLGVASGTFFTGRGDTRTTMWANVVASAANIVLDYVLIFGRWGFPELGITGAAIATVLSGFITPAILLGLVFGRTYNRTYRTRAHFRLEPDLMRRIVRYGIPSSIHLVLEVTAFSAFIFFTGRLGETALAVSNMAFSINALAFMPLIGLGITATTLVGKYQGRGSPELAERAGWKTLKIGVLFTLAMGVTYILFPDFYFAFFIREDKGALALEEVLSVGRVMLLLMALWGFMDAGNIILSGALKGAGDTRFVMLYSLAMSWGLLVTGEALIVLVFGGRILEAWGWLTFYVMAVAIGYLWRYRRGRWKSIDLLERRAPWPAPPCPPEAVVVLD